MVGTVIANPFDGLSGACFTLKLVPQHIYLIHHRAGRFAVMNKIDVLWDELQGEASTRQSIERVRNYSADHLGIQPQDVIPVSAKQGLVGRVKNDFELFQRSGIEQLEELIIQRILAHKEKLITGNLINDLLGWLK